MFHGRSIAPRPLCLLALLFATAARAQQPAPASLRLTWTSPDHPSGIYTPKSQAALTILIDNPSDSPLPLAGQILFTTTPDPSSAPAQNAPPIPPYKTISLTPLAPAAIAPNQRAKLQLTLTFAAAGTYQLRYQSAPDAPATLIENLTPPDAPPAQKITLQCIFAPRIPAASAAASPWLTPLPPPAVLNPDYLADFIQQTAIRRFLIDERFAFDPATNVGLGFGASLNADTRQIDALLAQTAKAKASLVLRITLPPLTPPDPRTLAAFAAYITDAARRSKGALDAIAIAPPPAAPASPSIPLDSRRAAYRDYYFAAYKAAKAADKNILLLGAGSAPDTFDLLLDPQPNQKEDLRPYLDAFAISNAAEQPALARAALGNRKIPLWLLPPLRPNAFPAPPPAAGLAQHCAVVPVLSPDVDRGVSAHLLAGTSFFQRVHVLSPTPAAPPTSAPSDGPLNVSAENSLPFIAVFQGDNYALAAIAGLSAGTDADAALPALAKTRTQVEPAPDPATVPLNPPEKSDPAYPNLEVSDDTHSMRVVDARGEPIDCRLGDSIFIPAEDHIVYLLAGGSAEELAASLRPATPNRFPLFDVTLLPAPHTFSLHLRNLTPAPLAGTLRLIAPSPDPTRAATILAEKNFPPIPPEKSLDLPFDLDPTTLPSTPPLVIELTTPAPNPQIQRTALRLP